MEPCLEMSVLSLSLFVVFIASVWQPVVSQNRVCRPDLSREDCGNFPTYYLDYFMLSS